MGGWRSMVNHKRRKYGAQKNYEKYETKDWTSNCRHALALLVFAQAQNLRGGRTPAAYESTRGHDFVSSTLTGMHKKGPKVQPIVDQAEPQLTDGSIRRRLTEGQGSDGGSITRFVRCFTSGSSTKLDSELPKSARRTCTCNAGNCNEAKGKINNGNIERGGRGGVRKGRRLSLFVTTQLGVSWRAYQHRAEMRVGNSQGWLLRQITRKACLKTGSSAAAKYCRG